ncbi:MAG: 1-deoxy-D-xylulose-5-phosphate synthase [Clostridia bacterium]|nr:1-deoxy-D-xylulose-5-phosphate synthase [Clostridia bacterium]
MNYSFLDGISSPSDLKKVNKSDIPALSKEIREFLIENAKERGGHLASNLGVVELTLAVHSVFDSPRDHIVFDVGHQSYVHKIVTGRRRDFDGLRTPGGLCGFTSMRESEHDAFGAGHSSTSVSAALGLAEADALSGKSAHTVCITGDGAFTGGMIHEALNNCPKDLPLVIILNENGMSISSNKGAFASYLSRVRVSKGYRRFKNNTKNFIDRIPLIGKPLHSLCSVLKDFIKGIIYKPNYFEELGLYYIGPIDGHDYGKICNALELAKSTGKACVVHVKTVKGKGYDPAESSPDGYHSLAASSDDSSFHATFANELLSLAEKNEKIVGVTAAMGIGTGLDKFGRVYPERYFDVGIAEQHALTFAAGLAAGGQIPYVAIYSTFLQRGYDSLLHDIALQNLPVNIMIDRAGLAVGDGATHHGIFDVSFISHIPNVTLLAPASYASLKAMTAYASVSDGPVAIRYPNSSEPTEALAGLHSVSNHPLCSIMADFDEGSIPEYIFITYGSLVSKVASAADTLRKEGMSVGIILVESLKPYGAVAKAILPMIAGAKRVLYAEEGIRNGGAAEIMREELILCGMDLGATEYRIAAIDDNFASPSSPCDLYDYVGLSADKLAEKMKK